MLTVLLLLGCRVSAGEWVVTKGGLSPDGKLAVVVYPQKTAFIDEADDTVLLVEPNSGRKIGPLEPEFRSWRHLIGLSIGRSRLPAPWAAS